MKYSSGLFSLIHLLDSPPFEIPVRRDLLFRQGAQYFTPDGDLEPIGLASEGAQLLKSGLSTEVIDTILSSRASATRQLYTVHLSGKFSRLGVSSISERIAISSLKRVGDLQALSVSPTCLEFAPAMIKAFLYSKQCYVPKVPTNIPSPIVLQAFCPPCPVLQCSLMSTGLPRGEDLISCLF